MLWYNISCGVRAVNYVAIMLSSLILRVINIYYMYIYTIDCSLISKGKRLSFRIMSWSQGYAMFQNILSTNPSLCSTSYFLSPHQSPPEEYYMYIVYMKLRTLCLWRFSVIKPSNERKDLISIEKLLSWNNHFGVNGK